MLLFTRNIEEACNFHLHDRQHSHQFLNLGSGFLAHSQNSRILITCITFLQWSSNRKWSRDRNWFQHKKLGMAWTPWKVYGWKSTSGIKVAIKNALNKLRKILNWRVSTSINFSLRKLIAKRNMNLRRCLSHLINRLELFPVHFSYLRPR